jgi:Na+/melibiose symporter-like transporter
MSIVDLLFYLLNYSDLGIVLLCVLSFLILKQCFGKAKVLISTNIMILGNCLSVYISL